MKIENVTVSGLPMETSFHEAVFRSRARRLASCRGGESHDCFLCGIVVHMNITAPRYWWPEFQRYHFADIVSSTSPMHTLVARIRARDDISDLFCQRTRSDIIEAFTKLYTDIFNDGSLSENEKIESLKANLPDGYLQTAFVVTNFRQLKTIYSQRRNHRLSEWREFCSLIKEIDIENLITGKEDDK